MGKKREGKRNVGWKFLFWAPRMLAILFIFFISLFAFDVFESNGDVVRMLAGFFMHLIPSLVLAAILVFAWKKEKMGGILFILLGIIFTIFFDTYEEALTFLLVSCPLFLTGILFWISGNENARKKD